MGDAHPIRAGRHGRNGEFAFVIGGSLDDLVGFRIGNGDGSAGNGGPRWIRLPPSITGSQNNILI
jgi:hypothetical protein